MAAIVILIIAILFGPLIGVLVLRKRVISLEQSAAKLKSRLESLEGSIVTEGKKEEMPTPVPTRETVIPQPLSQAVIPDVVEKKSPATNKTQRAKIKKTSGKETSAFWKKLEIKFLDNWTGILGAVIVVLGAGFLSIYAAIHLTEFFRFLLLLVLAAIPAGFYFYLRGKENWRRQAFLMRSISGAIFLFACLGSGGIPGLQWVEDPFYSLGLLILGILVNLGLGTLGGKQSFASFHTLLSLLALFLIPPGTPALFIAGIICLYAILQTYRGRWDIHLLLTITGFFSYHLFWFFTLQKGGFDQLIRIQGTGVIVMVFIAAALVHYRKNYASKSFEIFPFLVHLLNWLYFSVGMVLYMGDDKFRIIPLVLAALAAALLADRAGRKGISWLKTTDTMIFQVLAVTALLSLGGWNVPSVMIWGMIYAETVIFVRIMISQKRFELYRIGVNLSYVAAGFLVGVSLFQQKFTGAVLLAGATLLALETHRVLSTRSERRWILGDTFPGLGSSKTEFSITGLNVGLISVSALLTLLMVSSHLSTVVLIPPASLLLVIVLYYCYRYSTRGLFWGTLLFLLAFSLSGWFVLAEEWQEASIMFQVLFMLSLYLAGSASVFWLRYPGKGESLRLVGFLQITITTIIFSYVLLDPISAILPGIFWLVSATVLALVLRIPRDIRQMGLLFIGSFFFFLFWDYIYMDGGWGLFSKRYLMELLIIPVLYIWYRKKLLFSGRLVGKILNFFPEIILLTMLLNVFWEISLPWLPVAIGLLAIVTLLLPIIFNRKSRLVLYSLGIFWISNFMIIAAGIPLNNYMILPLTGSLSVLLGFVYVILCHRWASIGEVYIPSSRKAAIGIRNFFDKRLNIFLIYPLMLAAALFIRGTFRSDLQTFIWAFECFLVFSVSIYLGEEHFRYVSQGGLVLCVGRLIFFDLSGETLLTRGLVFLGVGVLMLGVNLLYNKYRSRFINKKVGGPSAQPVATAAETASP